MRFSRLSITNKGVSLTREDRNSQTGAVEEITLTSPERPRPSFDDALQAFDPYVRSLLDGAIDLADATLLITTLNLSQDKNGNRGLIVTATVPVPNASDRPLVLNTPLVREGLADLIDDAESAFVLTDEVMELITLVEAEAAKYVKGERTPVEVAAEKKKAKSENADAFDDRAASAEVASTRKVPVAPAPLSVMQ